MPKDFSPTQAVIGYTKERSSSTIPFNCDKEHILAFLGVGLVSCLVSLAFSNRVVCRLPIGLVAENARLKCTGIPVGSL